MGRIVSTLRIGHQLGLVLFDRSLHLSLVHQAWHRRRVVAVEEFSSCFTGTESWPDRIDRAVEIISEFLRRHNLRRVPVNIGLLGREIAFRRTYLPTMPPRELARAVAWNSERLFPFRFSDCLVHHQSVIEESRDDARQVGVNITAVKRDIIEVIHSRFAEASLAVGNIDFMPNFLAALSARGNSDATETGNLLVILDDDQSMAVFTDDGHLEFFQQFVIQPIAGPDDEAGPANIEAIAAELSSFIDLYNAQARSASPDAVILGGKYGQDTKAATFLAESTGLPCRRLIDMEGILPSTDENIRRQTACLPAAVMTGLAPVARRVLVPPSVQKRTHAKDFLIHVAAVVVITLLTVGGWQYKSDRTRSHLADELNAARSAVADLERSPGYQHYLNMVGRLNRSKRYLSISRLPQRSGHHLVLKELSLLLPENVRLTAINLSTETGGKTLSLDGRVNISDFAPEIVLAHYVESLENSPLFDSVGVARHRKKTTDDGFDLDFQLRMKARI